MTEARIKKQAKRIKKALKIPHYQALDLAAREAGFLSWKHAKEYSSALKKD